MQQLNTIVLLAISGIAMASVITRQDAFSNKAFPTLNVTDPNANWTSPSNGSDWWEQPPRDWTVLGTYCDYLTPCDGWYYSCSDNLGGVCGGPGAYCSSDDDCMVTCHGEYGGVCGSPVLDALDAQGSPVWFDDAGTVTTEAAWWYETDVPDTFSDDAQDSATSATDALVPTAPPVRRRYMKQH